MSKLFACNYRFYSNILMMIVMVIDCGSFIQSYQDPNYKNIVYNKPNSFNCDKSVYDKFYLCEKIQQASWKMHRDDYMNPTTEFCCFIWDFMDCEIKEAEKCSKDFANQIEADTKQFYEPTCRHIGAEYKSYSCVSFLSKAASVGIGAFLAGLLSFCAYHFRKGINTITNQMRVLGGFPIIETSPTAVMSNEQMTEISPTTTTEVTRIKLKGIAPMRTTPTMMSDKPMIEISPTTTKTSGIILEKMMKLSQALAAESAMMPDSIALKV
ncbi:uncharacterized protein LOC113791246 [Dermatophagoides pteronyssinus]|uniref:uncharacterized protein LOC113791246 n=1 Tax=Dermatophagoides pteronyssinus TaxID=6956 RepID=UPI003F68218D